MKIEIDKNKSINFLQSKYNVSRTTAWRAKRRGWLCTNYHMRKNKINPDKWDITQIEKGREYAFGILTKYSEIPFHLKEDFVSDAVLRYLEVSDCVKKQKVPAFIARTARWNANNYLKSKEKRFFEPNKN